MASVLMPISLLVKHYITMTQNMYFSEICIYLFGLLAIYVWLSKRRQNFRIRMLFDERVLVFFALFIISQFIMMMISYYTFNNGYFSTPVRGMVTLLVFLFFVFFHYAVVKIIVISEKDIKHFIKGSLISTLILLFVTYSQQLYLTFPTSPALNKLMDFYGTFFEARDAGEMSWYTNGSLVQTLYRINGFFTESAMLAAQIAIICLPFILAAIKNRYDIFNFKKYDVYSGIIYHLILVLLLGMLLLARTTTGIFAIVISMVYFWVLLPKKRKIAYGIVFCLALLFAFYLYKTNNNVHSIIYTYIFGKTSSFSTDNRIGNTIGLLVTFLHAPILGVGHGYTYHYLLSFTPKWSTHNIEFADFVNVRHSIPLLSIFSGWLAQYGILFVSILIIYIVKLQKNIFQLIRMQHESNSYVFYKTIGDASLFFFLMFVPLSFLNFGWNESSFLLTFFFFVVFRHFLYQKTYRQSHNKFHKIESKDCIRWLIFGTVRKKDGK